MSRLSKSRLSVVVAPDEVALLHTRSEMTWRGMRQAVLERRTIPSPPSGEFGWGGALGVLGSALPRFAQPGLQAFLILSNHFVNYVLVPWRDNMSDADELAYARHCFKEVYGDSADAWEVRVSPNRAGVPAVASAVDSRLIGELHALMAHAAIGVRAIQPHLMVAFNSCHSSMRGRDAWFALLEPGVLCLALLRGGQFAEVRKLRMGEAWHEELPGVLERERYLAEESTETRDVFLWAPRLASKSIPAGTQWNIMYLKPHLY